MRGDLPDLRDSAVQARLTGYLRTDWATDASIVSLVRADGGFSNETWLLDIGHQRSIDRVVLRRQALIGPLEPYDLLRESTILVELRRGSDVAVPEVYRYCADPEVLGSPFTIVERAEGQVPDYRSLPEFPPWSDPRNRTEMAREVVRALASIQDVRWRREPLASTLGGVPRHPPVIDRVHSWLHQLDRRVGRDNVLPVLRDSAAWLVTHAPSSPEDWVVVHGDFRVGNFMWQGLRIAAVLDWEGAGVGDVFEDLGYLCHPMARTRNPSLMGMLVPLDELAGIVEAELGRPLDLRRVHYYLVYALFFHLSTLVAGVAAAFEGADLRAGLGYSKFARVTRELIGHMQSYEDGHHVL